jgi:hypothetical protein
MRLKSIGVTVAIVASAVGGTAWAAQTISSIVGSDGTINGCYVEKKGALRVVAPGEACGRGELPIQWNQKGAKGDTGAPGPAGATGPQGARGLKGDKGDRGDPGPRGDTGPQGPQGNPAPALTSLAGIPCPTGSPDKPDGRTHVAVSDTGAMTFTCLSESTNPVLTVALVPGPLTCVTALGITNCFLSRFGVREVDANGAPVAAGFTCPVVLNQVSFPIPCETQRFGPGVTVRLEAVGAPTGLAASWTGCDSVSGAICTFTLAGARTLAITPT